MHDIEVKNMIEQAKIAMGRAHAPYSGQKAGACIKGMSGAYYTGCNVENPLPHLGICAERVAVYKGISECEHRFSSIALVFAGESFALPCQACASVLMEFCAPDTPVILANTTGNFVIYNLSDLTAHIAPQTNNAPLQGNQSSANSAGGINAGGF